MHYSLLSIYYYLLYFYLLYYFLITFYYGISLIDIIRFPCFSIQFWSIQSPILIQSSITIIIVN